MKSKKGWNKEKVFRTTKCFSPQTNRYAGGFPVGFLKYLKDNGWWGEKRCHLCCGMVNDPDSVRVDIRKDVNATLIEDARHTSLSNNKFDFILIDPPYSKELAKNLYNTEKFYSGIDSFTKEALRICKTNGLIVTLSYAVPKRIKGCDLIACIGVYQVINVANMRCLTVWRKR